MTDLARSWHKPVSKSSAWYAEGEEGSRNQEHRLPPASSVRLGSFSDCGRHQGAADQNLHGSWEGSNVRPTTAANCASPMTTDLGKQLGERKPSPCDSPGLFSLPVHAWTLCALSLDAPPRTLMALPAQTSGLDCDSCEMLEGPFGAELMSSSSTFYR